MSLHYQASAFATAIRQQYSGDIVKNARTGKQITAEIEPISDIELNTDLGRDSRSSHWIYILDPSADIISGDVIIFNGVRMQILPANSPDNSASVQRKFLAMQLSAKDA